MLQIDHIYEFFYKEIFNTFENWHLPGGVVKSKDIIDPYDFNIFMPQLNASDKILFYDQEPLIEPFSKQYIDSFNFPNSYSIEEIIKLSKTNSLPYNQTLLPEELDALQNDPNVKKYFHKSPTLVTSEHSSYVDDLCREYGFKQLYYFFHGFAALDWYRGYHNLNYRTPVIKAYKKDFISYNRIINNDRSYRIYLISKLAEQGLLDKGYVSFNVDNNNLDWRDEVSSTDSKLSDSAKLHIEKNLTGINKLIIDKENVEGFASANILRSISGSDYDNAYTNVDAFWHIVTETVFYYDKLHLTEKIFKPIVSKQPFMLLAAPGNLEYLRSYGFKTFDRWIDESYDTITDPDERINAVVDQIKWWTKLSDQEKYSKMCVMESTIEHNFHHFYNDFKNTIVNELITNIQTVFGDNFIKGQKIRQLLLL